MFFSFCFPVGLVVHLIFLVSLFQALNNTNNHALHQREIALPVMLLHGSARYGAVEPGLFGGHVAM
jgi:hypothetical protein